MSITVRIDTKALTTGLTALDQKQIPFAVSLALNRVGTEFQKAERAHFATVFTERRKEFLDREGVKRLSPPASKRNPSVTYGVSSRADFLNKFEAGDTKHPISGKHLAIPEQVKRNKRDIITKSNRPRQLVDRLGNRSGAGRVFVLRDQKGKLKPGVYQTTGKRGRGALKFLYSLAGQAKTPKVLQFEETAQRIVSQRWAEVFNVAFAEALRTAK